MDPSVLPGLRAYDSRDFAAALAAWEGERVRRAGRPGEAALFAALAALARGGLAEREGDVATAARERAAAAATLSHLPRRVLGVDVPRLREDLSAAAGKVAAVAPRPHAAHRGHLGIWLKAGALVLILGGTFAALRWTPLARLIEPERFSALLESARGHWWSPLVLLGLYGALCPLGFPATPLIFAGGAIFGSALGSALNVFGTLLGAASTFTLARYLGRDAVERLGGNRLARAERMLHRHGFWALVSSRFLPLPFPLVNAAAAVAGVRFPQFMASSVIGLSPAVVVWTYFSAAIVRAAAADRARIARDLVIALALLVSLVMIPTMTRFHRRRMRAKGIRLARARRLAAEQG